MLQTLRCLQDGAQLPNAPATEPRKCAVMTHNTTTHPPRSRQGPGQLLMSLAVDCTLVWVPLDLTEPTVCTLDLCIVIKSLQLHTIMQSAAQVSEPLGGGVCQR
jgi:hypothetical protein